ncbi:hypothetical protein GCM10010193_49950 [Kitasatospora atroaurantiaca]|uniref:Uncharacterized protein n=1 Tax=Kitasatospora atroaurantiaca TaxID=285545 RepID=A0A561EYE6_9ACTN|nr:hypothetical protein [Kitasatospora atroaurantiaca]TWE20630.1 hypothetical protein FB465_5785 [Kitasatospora atroaurantiaca]
MSKKHTPRNQHADHSTRPYRPGRRGRSRGAPLRQPVALAVAADPADYDCLRRHGMFGEADYASYLRRTEVQLRALRGQGVDVHLRVLEPADFEDFCEEHLLDPQDPVARVAYAADPELAGEPFLYTGERLAGLIPALLEDHLARVRISIGCAALLTAIGWDEEPEERLAAVLQYVSEVYLALAAGAGEGCHRLTLRSVGLVDGDELAASGELRVEAGELSAAGRGVEAFCVTLAAAVAGYGAGELLLHGPAGAGGGRKVYGWALVDGWLRPMSAVEVAAVLAAATGDGAADGPAEAVAPCPGFPLPIQAPAPWEGSAQAGSAEGPSPQAGGVGEAGR